MNRTYITIDGGTTNTRIRLVKKLEIIDTISLGFGAKAGMEGNEKLKTGIRDGINTLLEKFCLDRSNIECILAAGMITCEFGLCKLDHIVAPAGLLELHENMHKTHFPEICGIPFVFIRGVKTDCENLSSADMMRGEEAELMGIIDTGYGKCVYVLPGSHSKIIKTDESGRITDFSTMLTGEMIAALSQNTILKDAVDLSVSEINEEYLIKGYDYAAEHGINEALFKVRILKNLFGADKIQLYSFFMGICLSGEIEQILKTDAMSVVIGGRAQIKKSMAVILEKYSNKKIICLSDSAEGASSLGMIRIYNAKE